METNVLVLLDSERNRIVKIYLSEEDMNESLLFDDFECYISECLEDRYHFHLSNCQWMLSEIPLYEEIYR